MVMPKIVKPAVSFDGPVTKSSSESIVSVASSKISQVEKNKRSNNTPRKMPPVVKITPSVIQALNAAVSAKDRLKAISTACAEFDHYDKKKHAQEIDDGAVNALYQKLCLSLAAKDANNLPENEVNLIFSALEMVFRCPTVKREEAFNSIGESLLAILFHVLERCISIDGDESDSIMSHVLQILYYFSRVRPAATEMLQNPCMIPCFIHIILGDKNDSIRAKALVTLADLSCVEENGPIIAKHQVLLDAVVQVASLDLALEMREVATRAIQNISFHIDDTIPKKELEDIIKTLVKIENEDGSKIKKYVAGALQNLSTSKGNRGYFVTLHRGAVIQTIINLLRSDDADTKLRAIGAIKNLASPESTEILCSHKNFLQVISSVAANDVDAESKQNACEALHWLSSELNHPKSCHKDVLTALVQAAQRTDDASIALALLEQSYVPNNLGPMVAEPGLLDCLSRMAKPSAKSTPEVKEYAISALGNLARR